MNVTALIVILLTATLGMVYLEHRADRARRK